MGVVKVESPQDHPAFPAFREWVETAGVVRADLLEGGKHRPDWVIIWQTWLAGRRAGLEAGRPSPLVRAAIDFIKREIWGLGS